jgi:hypothetical protein
MNAYELADWIENGAPFGKYVTAKQAAVMLRQLQAEKEICINALNQIGSGTITGEETNYKAIVSVMRDIANDALYELNRNTMMTWEDLYARKEQEK